jgi:hypothetical protein
MLHACFYTICLVFHYTSWHFYAISGTNLLTRCHSASSLFFVVFVFQKSYTGHILGIGQNKFQNSYFSRTKDEDRKRAGGGPCGDPDLPSGIPVMHTIHDPRKTVMDPHNRVGITEYIIHYINKSQSHTWPLGRI